MRRIIFQWSGNACYSHYVVLWPQRTKTLVVKADNVNSFYWYITYKCKASPFWWTSLQSCNHHLGNQSCINPALHLALAWPWQSESLEDAPTLHLPRSNLPTCTVGAKFRSRNNCSNGSIFRFIAWFHREFCEGFDKQCWNIWRKTLCMI